MLKEVDVKGSEGLVGVKVLVSRNLPNTVRKKDGSHFTENDFDYWFKELAPNREGFILDVEEFREEYVKQVLSDPKAVDDIKLIWALAKNNDVYLVCREPAGYFCHRHILLSLINCLGEGVFDSERTCPYFMEGNKCFLKYCSTERETLGIPNTCDFAYYNGLESIKESKLKDCIYFRKKTGAFTCRTCYFYMKNQGYCLYKRKNLPADYHCTNYVNSELRYGNYYRIYQILLLRKYGFEVNARLKKYMHKEPESQVVKKVLSNFLEKGDVNEFRATFKPPLSQ